MVEANGIGTCDAREGDGPPCTSEVARHAGSTEARETGGLEGMISTNVKAAKADWSGASTLELCHAKRVTIRSGAACIENELLMTDGTELEDGDVVK